MNTYYLKKFRKAAKKHVKVEMCRDEYSEFVGIATNDYTRKITTKLVRLIPNKVLGWMFPRGLLYRPKLYYGKRDMCFQLIEQPSRGACLNGLSRDKQVEALYDARRLYIKMLIREERSMREMYQSRMEQIESERKMKRDFYELRRL